MKSNNPIDEYISRFPEETQKILRTIRNNLLKIVVDAEENISYGIPTLKKNGHYVIYFAGFKNHVSIYPINNLPEDLRRKVASNITGKGTLQFPLDKPMPYDIINEVARQLLVDYETRYSSKRNGRKA